jgi:hypothetical protein
VIIYHIFGEDLGEIGGISSRRASCSTLLVVVIGRGQLYLPWDDFLVEKDQVHRG